MNAQILANIGIGCVKFGIELPLCHTQSLYILYCAFLLCLHVKKVSLKGLRRVTASSSALDYTFRYFFVVLPPSGYVLHSFACFIAVALPPHCTILCILCVPSASRWADSK